LFEQKLLALTCRRDVVMEQKHTVLRWSAELTALVEAAVTPDRRGGVSRRLRAAPCSPWWGLGLNNRANRAPVPSTPEEGNTL
jgi:hypothetical protein